MNCKHS